MATSIIPNLPKGEWVSLWTGAITGGDTATLSRSDAKVLVLVVNYSTSATQYAAIALLPTAVSSVVYIPVQNTVTSSYLRCSVSGTTFTLTSVGDSRLYVKAIYGLV